MGAPDRTAAATVSPGSLPSITLFGIVENVLWRHQLFAILTFDV